MKTNLTSKSTDNFMKCMVILTTKSLEKKEYIFDNYSNAYSFYDANGKPAKHYSKELLNASHQIVKFKVYA